MIRQIKPKQREFKGPVNSHGFTLIEIMVVVLIMGLMVALLATNLARDLDRLARLEADRFLAILGEVRDEAIISGESYFLTLDENKASYQFTAARADKSIAGDDLFKKRSLQKGLELDWEVFDDFNSNSESRVLITPLGEITPFDARFIGEETEFHVLLNDDNQLERQDAEKK